jgi:hypothetical protein
MRRTRKETDLYGPIKQFMEAQGFAVKGEVVHCDLAAVREDQLVVVELKTSFNLTLVFQALERQKLTDLVYVAVEAPRSGLRWTDMRDLCRRLGLGFLTVHFGREHPFVEIVCEPAPYTPRKSLKGRARLLKEFTKRTGDHNIGGVTRRPIMTAYREDALRIADHLVKSGSGKPAEIRRATGITKTAVILQTDYYGWFERVERGVYRVAPKGEEALTQYATVVNAGSS